MNLVEQEQLLLKDIFHVRVNPTQVGDSLVELRQFPNDIKGLGVNVSLVANSTYFDSLLMQRLQIPKTETLYYLAECQNRCAYQKEKPWNQNPNAQNFINYSHQIIRNFIYLAATDPEIFPEQQVIDPEADKSVDKVLGVAMRLMTYFQQRGFDYEVFTTVYPRIREEEPKGNTFLENFAEVMLARHRFQTIADPKALFYVGLLQSLLTMQQFRKTFVTLPRTPFIPDKRGQKSLQGNVLDLTSPFGLFARVSLLGNLAAYQQQLKANMNFEQRIYADFGRIKYKKDFDAKVKYYTTMEIEYLNILKEVFRLMFKKDTQRVFFQWLYCVISGNQMRAKLGTRLSGAVNNTISHDGMMMNTYECMMEISKGILDKNQNTWTKIDPQYFRYAEHAKVCQYQPLNNKKDVPKMQIQGKQFGTVSQFFFITMQLLHISVIPTLLNFKQINQTKQRMQKQMQKMSKNHPMYMQAERQLQRLKIKFFQYYLVVMDELKIKNNVKLLDMLLFLVPKWLGIDYGNFRNGKLHMERGYMTYFLPEFLLNDVFEYHQFFCRIKENYVQLLGADHINSIINVTCLLLTQNGISTNPYVCANYIQLLFYFLMLNKGMMSQLLGNNQVAASNMTTGLVRFYSDIAFTGSSHQFYSKYKYRFYTNKIFTTLWQHDVYRKALKSISRTEQFERFINMIMTDSTYCFDEISEKYDKLKEYDMKRANNSMTPEDTRSEEMITGAMAGNLQQTVSNLKLLKNLSNWSPETFHAEAFLSTTVPLMNNMLATLVDPTSFANDRSIVSKYKFEKEFMLADLLTIYVNLNIKDILVNEIIRDMRYYKKQYFTNALQKAANENCTDQSILERFEALIGQLSNARQQQDQDQTIFGEIPDKYLCQIIGTLMKDPVLLPTSSKMVDRMYIHKHLLNDQRDPFNRKPLKLSQVVQQPALKKEIEEWKKKRLEELRNASSKQTKYGKKGEKKKENEGDSLFKENFIKYDE